jgi:hypothetical protein
VAVIAATGCDRRPLADTSNGGGGSGAATTTSAGTGGTGGGAGGTGGAAAACNAGQPAVCNPFGVDLDVPGLSGEAYWTAIKDTLQVPFYKPTPLVLDTGGACATCDAAAQHGLRLVLEVHASGGAGVATPPPTDLTMTQAQLGEVLAAHAAAVAAVVVEAGADTPATWAGSVDQYLALLTAACATAHQKGVACTDGGLASTTMILLLADYQLTSGSTAGALQVLIAAGDNPEVQAAFPTWPPVTKEDVAAGLATQATRLAAARALLAGVRGAGVDQVNFHWMERDQDTLDQAIAFLRNQTGCNAVAVTDLGQRTQDGFEASHKAGDARELGGALVIWTSRGAGGLVDAAGALTPNGTALLDLSLKSVCGD